MAQTSKKTMVYVLYAPARLKKGRMSVLEEYGKDIMGGRDESY
jgi:hypothetical protein